MTKNAIMHYVLQINSILDSHALALGEENLELWITPYSGIDTRSVSIPAILSTEEVRRASEFAMNQDRDRFIATRVFFRSYMTKKYWTQTSIWIHPRSWILEYTAYGKPYLSHFIAANVDGQKRFWDCAFNWSHSGEYIALAWGQSRMESGEILHIGVDLEYVRDETAILGIAKMLYTSSEYHLIERFLESGLKVLAKHEFFRLWTCYESKAKLEGQSLLHDLQNTPIFSQQNGFLDSSISLLRYYWCLSWRSG